MAVEGNDEFILTKAQSTWLRGGGGRGDHGEATSRMAGAFFAVASSNGTAMLGRQWRTALAQRCERREMKNGVATRSGRRWLEVEDNGSGVRPATTRGRTIRDPATCVPHAAPVV